MTLLTLGSVVSTMTTQGNPFRGADPAQNMAATYLFIVLAIVPIISCQRMINDPCEGVCPDLDCPYGMTTKSNGCPSCKCADNPCEKVRCVRNESCILIDSNLASWVKEPRCIDENIPGVCQQPRKSGPCEAAMAMWYFDIREHMCKEFQYGGCLGNHNNFRTRKECMNTCVFVPKRNTGTNKNCGLRMMCMMHCPFGYKLGSDGCPICSCKPDPCQNMVCPDDRVCRLANCYSRHNCQDAVPRCVDSCPMVKCSRCPYGYKRDKRNCQTCECLPHPCTGHQCPDLQVCEARKDRMLCAFPPCPARPACIVVQDPVALIVKIQVTRIKSDRPLNLDRFRGYLQQKFSQLMRLRVDSIINIEVSHFDELALHVKFMVHSFGTADLIQSYRHFKQEVALHNSTTLRFEGHVFIPESQTLQVTAVESRRWSPHGRSARVHTYAVIGGAAAVGVVLVVLVAAFVARRRRGAQYYRGSSIGVPYKRAREEDRVNIM